MNRQNPSVTVCALGQLPFQGSRNEVYKNIPDSNESGIKLYSGSLQTSTQPRAFE